MHCLIIIFRLSRQHSSELAKWVSESEVVRENDWAIQESPHLRTHKKIKVKQNYSFEEPTGIITQGREISAIRKTAISRSTAGLSIQTETSWRSLSHTKIITSIPSVQFAESTFRSLRFVRLLLSSPSCSRVPFEP